MSKTIGEKLEASVNGLDALLTYANGVTGADDVSIGDAVKALAAGFGQGGGGNVWGEIGDPIAYTVTENARWKSPTEQVSYNNYYASHPIDVSAFDCVILYGGSFHQTTSWVDDIKIGAVGTTQISKYAPFLIDTHDASTLRITFVNPWDANVLLPVKVK